MTEERKWTNRTGISPIITAALLNDDYTRGKSDISVTQIIDSPYLRKQMKRAEMADVEVDVSTRMYALFGKLIHAMLEKGYDSLDSRHADMVEKIAGSYHELKVEERLYAEDLGVTWSGQYDLYYAAGDKDDKRYVLEDHKVCSVGEYSAQRGEDKWTKQLNLLALLARRNGYQVDELAINAYFRDWSKMKAKGNGSSQYSNDYPPAQHARIRVPLWDIEKQQAFLEEQLARHVDPNPEPCNMQERWCRQASWKVMSPYQARALRVLATEEDAKQWLMDARTKIAGKLAGKLSPAMRTDLRRKQKDVDSATVVEYHADSIRCANYCEAAAICPWWIENGPPKRISSSLVENDPLRNEA